MPATSSVFLNVSNIEKSLEWYRNLGFKVDKPWKDDSGKVAWADLSLDGADLGLGHIPSNDDPAYRQWVSTPLGAGVIVYFTVADADKVWAKAQKVKATVEMPITDRPYGRMFTLNDPDGYTISFITEAKKATVRRPKAKEAMTRRPKATKATKRSAPKAKKAAPKRKAK